MHKNRKNLPNPTLSPHNTPPPLLQLCFLKKAQLYYCQSNLDKAVALRNSSRASANSITQYCVCFSSGATDFLIYLLLPLPSQTDHLSPVAIGSPRRKRTPNSFLSILNTLIFIWSNLCQHLRQSQRSSSFWWSCLDLMLLRLTSMSSFPGYTVKKNQSRLNQLDLTVILTRFRSEWSKVPSCLTCTTPASVNNTCNFNWNHLVAWNGMNRALLPAWQLPEPGRQGCWDHRADTMLSWSCSLIACRCLPD